MLRPLACLAILLLSAAPAAAGDLVEPRLTLPSAARQQPHVALTLDACSGKADGRIIKALVDNRIPATIFVTARWLRDNAASLKVIMAHPDLFQIENHGARHVPAVDHPLSVFGIKAAGSAAAVRQEISGGATAILAATGHVPRWFRGATGKYSRSAMAIVTSQGEAVAGYSLVADDGARLGTQATAHRILKARDGDVIIAHVNHPERPAGKGVVDGILALKAKGYVFIRLGTPPRPRKRPRQS